MRTDQDWWPFLAWWHGTHGEQPLTARQVWQSWGIALDEWQGTFPFLTGRPESVSLGREPVKSLGRWLAGQVDRWYGDLVLCSGIEPHLKYRVYWVHRDPRSR
jgi:hypothetical protein